jgi:signal transduction histidine kinase/DNA-binding response OmpR family regulator
MRQPFGKGTRTIYYLLASFIVLTVFASAYLNFRLASSGRDILNSNQRSAALIAAHAVVEDTASQIDTPGNDIFLTGDVERERQRLTDAVAKFREAMKIARASSRGDQVLMKELDDVDTQVAKMVSDTEEIFRAFSRRQVDAAAALMSTMDRQYAIVRRELSDAKVLLEKRQFAEFRRQSEQSRVLARDQAWSGSLVVLLVIGLVGYGRRIDREVAISAERERALESRTKELVQSQQLLSEAQRIAQLGAWEWEIDSGRVTWSDELFRIFGYEPGSFVPSYTAYIDRVVPEDRDRVAQRFAQCTKDHLPFELEYGVLLTDGQRRMHYAAGRVDVDAGGKAVRMFGISHDITERRAIERMKDEFISTVSHELRTPLTSIRGALGLLSSGRLGKLEDKAQRLLEIASTNTDRLVRLINDILDIERIESGKVMLLKSETDAAELVRHAADIVRPLADAQNIELAVEAESSRLVADPDRMIQTLTNLLGNAVKFSPVGSTVRVHVKREGDNVVFTVADQGRGIPADKLTTVFERFQQVDASDSRDKGGSGLGLAICRSIVRQHGGQIGVSSAAGRGTTFTVSIPAGISGEPEAAPLPAEEKLIYICDDDPASRDALNFFLSERGYRVRETSSGQELLDAVAEQKPDAVLLDLFMPGMNGWETLARLKGDPSTADLPVIVVSLLSQDETGDTGFDVAGWIEKPFDERSLVSVVDRAFRRDRKRPRLLLVEDDMDLAATIIASFERYGIETIHAQNGKQAIELARRVVPDLLILDPILPDVDGYEVVDWLKDHEVWRNLPLVVYSATEPSPSQRERLRLGPTEFMTKSRLAPEEFERRIVALLDTLNAGNGGSVTHVA